MAKTKHEITVGLDDNEVQFWWTAKYKGEIYGAFVNGKAGGNYSVEQLEGYAKMMVRQYLDSIAAVTKRERHG